MDRATALEQVRALLQRGAPWEACDVFRSALAAGHDDPEALYWGALAHARSGASRQSRKLLDRVTQALDASPATRRESLCLSGRLWKDRIDRSPDGEPVGLEAARRARDDYLAAYALDTDSYPGANAATLTLLLEERDEARGLAARIVDDLSRRSTLSAWQEAAFGESCVILGRIDDAREAYRRACAIAPDDTGSIGSMRRQLSLIERVIPAARDLLDTLPAAVVIAFAGHMIDDPHRARPRFPPWLEGTVAEALRDWLAPLRRPLVYASAACGSDILFCEAALAVDAEITIVLPFDRDDFIATSVAIAGPRWVERFHRVLARATRVVQATDEHYLGHDVLFEHAQRLISGFAVLRASQLQTQPSMLSVLDAQTAQKQGGTRTSHERWSRVHGGAELIELDTLLREAKPPRDRPAAPQHVADSAPPAQNIPQRTLKFTLFADVAGFGRLHDAQAPIFHGHFLGLIAAQIAACSTPPLEANTWGDALYMVFATAEEGATFGLGLIDRMRRIDWADVGLSSVGQIRVALHAGPVFCGFDPIIQRDNYFGTSVTTTARIEPITPPGLVYASEAFVASLAAQGDTRFLFEYVGELDLAKQYGRSRIYCVERR